MSRQTEAAARTSCAQAQPRAVGVGGGGTKAYADADADATSRGGSQPAGGRKGLCASEQTCEVRQRAGERASVIRQGGDGEASCIAACTTGPSTRARCRCAPAAECRQPLQQSGQHRVKHPKYAGTAQPVHRGEHRARQRRKRRDRALRHHREQAHRGEHDVRRKAPRHCLGDSYPMLVQVLCRERCA